MELGLKSEGRKCPHSADWNETEFSGGLSGRYIDSGRHKKGLGKIRGLFQSEVEKKAPDPFLHCSVDLSG